MFICGQRRLPYAFDGLPESGIPAEVRPNRKRVREIAYKAFLLRAIASGDRSTDDQVRLPRIPCDERLERCKQRHEQRRRFAGAELLRGIERRLRKVETLSPALEVLNRGTPLCRGELEERRCAAQVIPPENQLVLQHEVG